MEETEKQKKVAGRAEWTVECTTLDAFVAAEVRAAPSQRQRWRGTRTRPPRHRSPHHPSALYLPSSPRAQGIDPSKLVLKIDTEGAEKDILLQLKPWIEKYKPSMLLSMVRLGGFGGRRE